MNQKQNTHQDNAGLFRLFDQESARDVSWADLFNSNFKTIAQEFRQHSRRENFQQEEIDERLILWRDPHETCVICMFYFISDVTELNAIFQCFQHIKQYDVQLTYIIARQQHQEDIYFDVFRSSRFSVLEHCYRFESE
jgi:hypothetical protein